ncbi:dethiobiotin synthase [Pseudophaeobacter flagellatus]|uniref:dethiobiotin synthase n=1 Tax=Pseudophaeobacter flagellatus TaxID=2899119 RepID=UPI001E3A323E|nr:dethiobiotin synthase [Pseudophaeobacter flagellatus]MCD9146320.1 dethiobiotin synthase [Pseudophaeobacter flagellatus]
MRTVVVTGTDTGIGKTIFSAGLVQALQASYWKPVQSGLEEETDSETVERLSGGAVLAEAYRLQHPASPHLSAEAEGVEIDPESLTLPQLDGPLVVEGAGGVMVPLNRRMLYLDLFAKWGAPVILCARTQLGTINHTLLSVQALRAAGCRVLGVVFIGAPEREVEDSICLFGKLVHLGRLPMIPELGAAVPPSANAAGDDALAAAFAAHIKLDLIRAVL